MSSSSDFPLTAIPAINKEIQNELFKTCCSIINLWEHGLRVQKQLLDSGQVLKPGPGPIKTIMAVDSMRMINLVPMDAPHPLYHAAPEYSSMRHSFLLNAMLESELDFEDPSLPQGITLTNTNGKDILFKKDDKGEITANGTKVTAHHRLSDGTLVIITEALLFDQEKVVKDAFQRLMASTSAHGGCGTGLCGALGQMARDQEEE